MKNILFIDTSLNACSAGVIAGGKTTADTQIMERGQAEALAPLIQDVIARAGVEFDDLDAVLTTLGPGAFTGLRVGLSTAKSLALALGIPLYGLTTLQALALEMPEAQELTVIIESKRVEFYVQSFGSGAKPFPEASLALAEQIEQNITPKTTLIGNGVGRFQELAGPHQKVKDITHPNPEAVLQAFLDPQSRAKYFTETIEPVYLRGADVSKSKKTQRILASNDQSS